MILLSCLFMSFFLSVRHPEEILDRMPFIIFCYVSTIIFVILSELMIAFEQEREALRPGPQGDTKFHFQ